MSAGQSSCKSSMIMGVLGNEQVTIVGGGVLWDDTAAADALQQLMNVLQIHLVMESRERLQL